MGLLSLEHSPTVYWADFAWHAALALGLAVAVGAGMPATPVATGLGPALALAAAGAAAWTLAEYLLHRFVLHGLPPFKAWHVLHHQRPRALICGPTLLSSTLIGGLVFVPAWWLLGAAHAQALTLGLVLGYLAYGVVHHGAHHGGGGAWMRARRRWHALHHHAPAPGGYGVSTGLWDHVFATVPTPGCRRPTTGTLPAAGP
ncbi:sterol desaturase family protein [Pseudaquabacterium pictum]|uniref:Fatty acid hydroxylase n=1 Tax=Pseudaquabacterium pictum TaxID=2315236 RepID=A0A480AJU5_9BURK|nr:sterol desaturase family protein [Rubrivivax pictus]GCL61811.1 fatty acid hydroxylase [Rubrivivax pictus]